MKPKLYLDEGIHSAMARTLRGRGIDARSFAEAGRYGAMDIEQLDEAIAEARAVVTYDRDHFMDLATRCFSEGIQHWGIVISPQYEFGELLRRLLRLCEIYEAEHLTDQIIYLQSVR